MSRKQNIEDRVKQIVVEQLGVKPVEVTRDKYFIDDLGADSLDCVEIIMAVEEEFEFAIPERDADKLKTVGALIDYLKERLSRKDK